MTFDEAIGIGRVISAIQRRMLLEMDNWPDGQATAYNRDELVWKELIFRTSWSPAYQLTERGQAVVMALQMRALSDCDLLRTFKSTSGHCATFIAALREIEDRRLDF